MLSSTAAVSSRRCVSAVPVSSTNDVTAVNTASIAPNVRRQPPRAAAAA